MKDPLSIVISALALIVSLTTLWLTARRGKLKMTKPAFVGFLYDLPAGEPKVFLRMMLFSTGKRGHVIENLYLKVRRGESTQVFNFWMYGELGALKIGSGLRVTEEGIVFDHHFLPPKDRNGFEFQTGEYVIEIYARIVQQSKAVLLRTINIPVTQEHSGTLADRRSGVFFTWGPESQSYSAHIGNAPDFQKG